MEKVRLNNIKKQLNNLDKELIELKKQKQKVSKKLMERCKSDLAEKDYKNHCEFFNMGINQNLSYLKMRREKFIKKVKILPKDKELFRITKQDWKCFNENSRNFVDFKKCYANSRERANEKKELLQQEKQLTNKIQLKSREQKQLEKDLFFACFNASCDFEKIRGKKKLDLF